LITFSFLFLHTSLRESYPELCAQRAAEDGRFLYRSFVVVVAGAVAGFLCATTGLHIP